MLLACGKLILQFHEVSAQFAFVRQCTFLYGFLAELDFQRDDFPLQGFVFGAAFRVFGAQLVAT